MRDLLLGPSHNSGTCIRARRQAAEGRRRVGSQILEAAMHRVSRSSRERRPCCLSLRHTVSPHPASTVRHLDELLATTTLPVTEGQHALFHAPHDPRPAHLYRLLVRLIRSDGIQGFLIGVHRASHRIAITHHASGHQASQRSPLSCLSADRFRSHPGSAARWRRSGGRTAHSSALPLRDRADDDVLRSVP